MEAPLFHMILPTLGCGYTVFTDGAYLSGARRRIGYSETVYTQKVIRDRGWNAVLTDAVVNPPYIVHEVERNLFLLKATGHVVKDDSIEIWLGDGDRKRVEYLLASKPEGHRLIAVAIGSREQHKSYPPELLAKALNMLVPKGCCFALLGGPEEAETGERIREVLPDGVALNLAGNPLAAKSALTEIGSSAAPQMASLVQQSTVAGRVISDRLSTAFSTKPVEVTLPVSNFADGGDVKGINMRTELPVAQDNNAWVKFTKNWGDLRGGANYHGSAVSGGYDRMLNENWRGGVGVELKRYLNRGSYGMRLGVKHAFAGADPELSFCYEGNDGRFYTLRNSQDKTHFVLSLSGET